MAIRVLLLLLSVFICVNIVIILVSLIFGQNLYKTHGIVIRNGFGILILIIVVLYVIASILGLSL